jgi:dTDP-4-dehydrorhamnose reductase
VIVVFGGNGQLGQELARAGAGRGAALTAIGRDQADITDASAVAAAVTAYRPTLVVNAAAYTKVDLAETETAGAAAANSEGPAVLARACAGAGIPLLHVSTDYVFDGRTARPYLETDVVNPLNAYGRSKAAGEAAIKDVLPRHIILRTAWIYGEFGHNFLKTIVRLAADRKELRVVADQFGTPTSTRDLATTILRIAPRVAGADDAGLWGTYHFTASGATTWHEFATAIVAAQAPLTGRAPKVTAITTAEYPTPAVRPANAVLDCGKFGRVFGFRGRPWADEAADVTRAVINAQQKKAAHVA